MKTFLIVLGVLILLFLLPFSARVRYRGQLNVYAGVIFPFIKVYPFGQKQRKKTGKKKKKNEKTVSSKKKKHKTKIDFSSVIELIRRFPRDLKRLITVRDLKMDLLLGNSDPADLALLYGTANAVTEYVLALLSPVFPVDRWKIKTQVDFERDTSEFSVDLFAYTNLLHVFSVLFSLIYRVIIKKEV